jgi:hypothetical protein
MAFIGPEDRNKMCKSHRRLTSELLEEVQNSRARTEYCEHRSFLIFDSMAIATAFLITTTGLRSIGSNKVLFNLREGLGAKDLGCQTACRLGYPVSHY